LCRRLGIMARVQDAALAFHRRRCGCHSGTRRAPRPHRDLNPGALPLLRVDEAVEARRGHHRDAGGDPAAVEGDPDGAREVQPGLRDDHAAAGADDRGDAPGSAMKSWAGPAPEIADTVAKTATSTVQYRIIVDCRSGPLAAKVPI
jgi:hypothetical protein